MSIFNTALLSITLTVAHMEKPKDPVAVVLESLLHVGKQLTQAPPLLQASDNISVAKLEM